MPWLSYSTAQYQYTEEWANLHTRTNSCHRGTSCSPESAQSRYTAPCSTVVLNVWQNKQHPTVMQPSRRSAFSTLVWCEELPDMTLERLVHPTFQSSNVFFISLFYNSNNDLFFNSSFSLQVIQFCFSVCLFRCFVSSRRLSSWMFTWLTRPPNRFLASSQTNQYRLSIRVYPF